MIDARWVGARFATDPGFAIPPRPRFPREFLVLPSRDGLYVDGAAERQFLRGRAAADFLPQLIVLLDGTRTLEDLAAACGGRPAQHVRDAVTLLYSRGLLEDGPLGDPDDHVGAFLGRFIDHTRHHRNRADARAQLARTSATLVAPAEIAALLRTDLLDAGVGSVEQVRADDEPVPAADLTLVVETVAFSAQRIAPRPSGAWTLYTTLGPDRATVGPLTVPGFSPCYACYAGYYRELPKAAASAAVSSLWAGLIGINAFNLLSRIAIPQLYNRMQRISRSDGRLQTERYIAPRVPSCAACGCRAELVPDDPAFAVWALHSMTAMPPRDLMNHRSYQDHFKPANIALAQTLPQPQVGATLVHLAAENGEPVRGLLGRAQLGLLLHWAAGYEFTPAGTPHRLTPTGGNLASPELYVLARDVADVPDGLYRYVGATHQLEWARAFDPYIAQVLAGPAGSGPRAIVVGTGLLDRVFSKYQMFAYRVVNVDAGFCLLSMLLGAAALNVGSADQPDFDPRHVAELLQLPARSKLRYPTFVLSLFEREEPATYEIGTAAFERVLHGNAHVRRGRIPIEPPVAGLVARWPAILRNRRSVRDFAPAAVARPIVERIVADAIAIGRHYRRNRGRSIALQPYVAVAHDAAHLPAGLYRYDAGLIRTGDLPAGSMAALMQQQDMTSAAIGVFVTTDLDRLFASRGPGGYREALVAAGVFAAGIIHAASAAGIAACPSGGFFEHGLRETQRSDGFHDCPLFAVALGHARDGGPL